KSEKDRGDRMKSRAPKTPESVRISEDEKLGFEAFWEQYQDLLDQLAAKKLAIERKENDVDETRETGRKHHAELQKLVKERDEEIEGLRNERTETLRDLYKEAKDLEEELEEAEDELREIKSKVKNSSKYDDLLHKYKRAVKRLEKEMHEARRDFTKAKQINPESDKPWKVEAGNVRKKYNEIAKTPQSKLAQVRNRLGEKEKALAELKADSRTLEDKIEAMNEALETHYDQMLKACYARVNCRYTIHDGKARVTGGRWIECDHRVDLADTLEEEGGKVKALADNFLANKKLDKAYPLYALIVDRFPGTKSARKAASLIRRR
ncbi:MAG: hypothetical protein KGZ25_11525, partial [Planctomycetes bacterium]|nr:hypothetical protein [Planctomycetota bacterium]